MSATESSALGDTQGVKGNGGCDCAASRPATGLAPQEERPQAQPEPNLEDLLPIAIMIAAGCETCAE